MLEFIGLTFRSFGNWALQRPSLTSGGFVSAGNILSDGHSQFAISPDRSGGPRVAIYDLDGSAAAAPFDVHPGGGLTQVNNFLSVDANFRGGARTAVGDLNGDGHADLVVAAGFGSGPAIVVINGTQVIGTNGFTPSDDRVGNFYGFDPRLRDGAYVAIGDVLGNGQQDLILGPGDGGPAQVVVVSGSALVNQGATAAFASPIARFTPMGLGPDGAGMRVAAVPSGKGRQLNVAVGPGRDRAGLIRMYPGTSFGSGKGEPGGSQLLDPFAGAVLTDGVFVG